MENCNHRYSKGDICCKCGHKRAANNKIPRYKQERLQAELMAELMPSVFAKAIKKMES